MGVGGRHPRVEGALVTIAGMYDFESVSVSSYEAASLAATLTEKSADGWEVVAIVPAGSDVVAYLRRLSSATGGGANADAADTDATKDAVTAAAVTDGTSNTLQLGESETTDTAAELLTPTDSTADITTPTQAPATTSTSPSTDSGGTGWGAGAETSAASSGGWSGASESSEPAASSSWGGSAQEAATAAATPAVPAGWYADPAGRYELRYWDGSAWTEHVSRQGQQYTDPPVA